jgi:hypothetical protein
MRRGGLIRSWLLALIAVALLLPSAAGASFPGANGRIAFVRGASIFTMNSDGSDVQQLTSGFLDGTPRWSPDGTKIAFNRSASIWIMNADGTGQAQVPGDTDRREAGWSPDGQRIAFRSLAPTNCDALYTMSADGTDEQLVLAVDQGPCRKFGPVWSSRGEIAFNDYTSLYTVRPDGTGSSGAIDAGFAPDWSPAGSRLVYKSPTPPNAQLDLYTISPDGSGKLWLAQFPQTDEHEPAWSPDGTAVAFNRAPDSAARQGIYRIDDGGGGLVRLTAADDSAADWQPLPPLAAQAGYPRPKSASPVSVSLVLAYEQCTAPNRLHGPPLAFNSCSPPQQTSQALTTGTADSNGQPTKFIGLVRFNAVPGDPATPANEADVLVSSNMVDVRCKIELIPCTGGALSDYVGTLRAWTTIRITDRYNGGAVNQAATVSDWIQFFVPIQCSETADSTVGSTCASSTMVNALIPGAIRERARATWELDQVVVRDGGLDGDPRADEQTVFAVQGLFVP